MKPICFFDLETTGTDKRNDRIVEIAIIKLDGEKEESFESLVNPGIPIPPEATQVHGITDEKVSSSPSFGDIQNKVTGLIEGSDVAGFNSNSFDIPFLYNELARNGYVWDLSKTLFLDAYSIYRRKETRTLVDAVRFYLQREHEGAHGAMADVRATLEIFKAQREKYRDLPATRQELALYCNEDKRRADLARKFFIDADGDYVINFGQHRGKKAKENLSYLQWMLGADFDQDTKEIAKRVFETSAVRIVSPRFEEGAASLSASASADDARHTDGITA